MSTGSTASRPHPLSINNSSGKPPKTAASTLGLGVAPNRPPAVQSGGRNVSQPSHGTSYSISGLSSFTAQRSLSAFSGTASEIALNPAQHERSRSASNLLTASQHNRTPSTTLAELIAAEVAQSASNGSNTTGHTSDSSSFPKTPSEGSTAAAGQPKNTTLPYQPTLLAPSSTMQPAFQRQHRSGASEFGIRLAPFASGSPAKSSMHTARAKDPSSTHNPATSTLDRMKERHRMEARQSGILLEGQKRPDNALPPSPSKQRGLVQSGSLNSLHGETYALHAAPCPPGVDPYLYASRRSPRRPWPLPAGSH